MFAFVLCLARSTWEWEGRWTLDWSPVEVTAPAQALSSSPDVLPGLLTSHLTPCLSPTRSQS